MSFWRKLTLLALAGFVALVAAVVISAVLNADSRSDLQPSRPAHTFVLE
ncbi:MAG TPA: hypothetical protein VFG30_32790 [Polyangiales bacterium]|nr:hypothetical protein [Polyangiales bacterium]